MILDKIAKNIKKNRPKKVPIAARGYNINCAYNRF
mgnify:FL=1